MIIYACHLKALPFFSTRCVVRLFDNIAFVQSVASLNLPLYATTTQQYIMEIKVSTPAVKEIPLL